MLALADCILTCDGVSIPVSLPVPDGALPAGRHKVLLGLSATGAALARELVHRDSILTAKGGTRLAKVRVLNVHPALAVATAELQTI